mgnify:CR=1 FL=1
MSSSNWHVVETLLPDVATARRYGRDARRDATITRC